MGRKANPSSVREFVRGPGIDTRYWIKLAHVDAVVVDPDEGIFADVSLLPEQQTVTAFVGTGYAGDGFGFHAPIQEDDLVLVAIPDGDTDAGAWVISRGWNSGDKPHADFQSTTPIEGAPGMYHPKEEVILRAKPGTKTTIVVSAGANVDIKVEGAGNCNLIVNSGSVNLGSDSHGINDGVVHGSGFDTLTGVTYTALGNTSQKVFARKT